MYACLYFYVALQWGGELSILYTALTLCQQHTCTTLLANPLKALVSEEGYRRCIDGWPLKPPTVNRHGFLIFWSAEKRNRPAVQRRPCGMRVFNEALRQQVIATAAHSCDAWASGGGISPSSWSSYQEDFKCEWQAPLVTPHPYKGTQTLGPGHLVRDRKSVV